MIDCWIEGASARGPGPVPGAGLWEPSAAERCNRLLAKRFTLRCRAGCGGLERLAQRGARERGASIGSRGRCASIKARIACRQGKRGILAQWFAVETALRRGWFASGLAGCGRCATRFGLGQLTAGVENIVGGLFGQTDLGREALGQQVREAAGPGPAGADGAVVPEGADGAVSERFERHGLARALHPADNLGEDFATDGIKSRRRRGGSAGTAGEAALLRFHSPWRCLRAEG